MLSDIVTNVVDPQPDLRLVEGTDSEPAPQADMAITCANDEELPPALRESLCVRHYTRVLALSEDGRRASIYKLQPARTELTDVSPASLLAAIRERG